MVNGPKETSVEPRGHVYRDVLEQAAIDTVPDLNGITSGCRNSITLRRVFRCYHPLPVVECAYFSASCEVPDGGRAVPRCCDESSRIRREIDSEDVIEFLPACEDFVECVCVPYNRITVVCARCDPSAILRHSERTEIPCCCCCHLFSIFHSPHPNSITTAADEVLAIRCKCHRTYSATEVDFDEGGTLLSNGQYQRNSILLVRTVHRRSSSISDTMYGEN